MKTEMYLDVGLRQDRCWKLWGKERRMAWCEDKEIWKCFEREISHIMCQFKENLLVPLINFATILNTSLSIAGLLHPIVRRLFNKI